MYKYFFFLLSIILIGCNSGDSYFKRIVVDVKKVRQSMPLSLICDSLKYLPLETTDQSLFQDIDKLCMDKQGNIFILDRNGTNAIYKFNPKGKFERCIGATGRGPGEYLKIADFNIYQDTIVEIYDDEGAKCLFYSCKGHFLEEMNNLGYGYAKFIHFCDTLAYYSSAGGYAPNLTIHINDNKYTYFRQRYSELSMKNQYFHFDGNQIFYTDNYNDTIFYFQTSHLKPYLYIDFKKNKLPAQLRNYQKISQSNYCYGLDDIIFTSRFMLFSFTYQKQGINGIWDTKTKETHLAKTFENDIDGIPFLIYSNTFSDTAKILTAIDANSLIDVYGYYQENQLPISQTYLKLLKQVDENSNPVIIFAYLKK